jgi:hypothetical protein
MVTRLDIAQKEDGNYGNAKDAKQKQEGAALLWLREKP